MVKYKLGFFKNWKVLLMGLFVNMVAIALTVLLVPGIHFLDRRLSTLILLAVALGLLNTLVKPIFQLFTIRLVFITYGINIIIINALMLYILDWIFGDAFDVDGLFAAILGAILIWTISTFLDYVLGVLPPLGYVQALREEEGEL